MSELENKKENALIEFIEKTTSTVNSEKITQNEELSKILENNTEYDESTSKGIVDDISNTLD